MKSNQDTRDPLTRPATPDDYWFAYELKKQALGPYVKEVWGWDEEVQLSFHSKDSTLRDCRSLLCVAVILAPLRWCAARNEF